MTTSAIEVAGGPAVFSKFSVYVTDGQESTSDSLESVNKSVETVLSLSSKHIDPSAYVVKVDLEPADGLTLLSGGKGSERSHVSSVVIPRKSKVGERKSRSMSKRFTPKPRRLKNATKDVRSTPTVRTKVGQATSDAKNLSGNLPREQKKECRPEQESRMPKPRRLKNATKDARSTSTVRTKAGQASSDAKNLGGNLPREQKKECRPEQESLNTVSLKEIQHTNNPTTDETTQRNNKSARKGLKYRIIKFFSRHGVYRQEKGAPIVTIEKQESTNTKEESEISSSKSSPTIDDAVNPAENLSQLVSIKDMEDEAPPESRHAKAVEEKEIEHIDVKEKYVLKTDDAKTTMTASELKSTQKVEVHANAVEEKLIKQVDQMENYVLKTDDAKTTMAKFELKSAQKVKVHNEEENSLKFINAVEGDNDDKLIVRKRKVNFTEDTNRSIHGISVLTGNVWMTEVRHGKNKFAESPMPTIGESGKENSGKKSTQNSANISISGDFIHSKSLQTMASEALKHGDFVRAVKCFTEILVRNKERHGKISEQVGIDLHNIGVVQIRGGLFTDALSICQEAVNVRKAVLGPNHPDVASSLIEIGVVLLALEQFDRCLVCFERALKIRRNVFGEVNAQVANAFNNVGCVFLELDELDKAINAFYQGLQIQLKIHEQDPEDVPTKLSLAASLCNVGFVHLKMKRYAAAVQAFDEALSLQQSILGASHYSTWNTLDNLAFSHSKIHDYDTALDTYGKLLSRQKPALGEGNFKCLATMRKMSYMHIKNGDFDAAVETIADVLDLQKQNSHYWSDSKSVRKTTYLLNTVMRMSALMKEEEEEDTDSAGDINDFDDIDPIVEVLSMEDVQSIEDSLGLCVSESFASIATISTIGSSNCVTSLITLPASGLLSRRSQLFLCNSNGSLSTADSAISCDWCSASGSIEETESQSEIARDSDSQSTEDAKDT